MSSDKLKYSWPQISIQLQRKWGRLTNSDIAEISGDKDLLLQKLCERYGYEIDSAILALDALVRDCNKNTSVESKKIAEIENPRALC